MRAGFSCTDHFSIAGVLSVQIQCHSCRSPLMLNGSAGQYRCPHCQAINVVVAPVAGAPASSRGGARTVVAVFLGCAVVALLAGWWGLALGVGLLAWALAGALGKVKGPGALLRPTATKTGVSALGIGLGALVATCGALGGVSARDGAARRARAAEEAEAAAAAERAATKERAAKEAAARAAHEAELQANLGAAARSYAAGLAEVDGLVANERWDEADAKLREVAAAIADYRELTPPPEALAASVSQHSALQAKLDGHRREAATAAWIAAAEAIVGDRTRCQDHDLVANASAPIDGLRREDPRYADVEALRAKLDQCARDMPPPSEWRYAVRDDPMGGQIAFAKVLSRNTFEFDFPYAGEQRASLTIREGKGTDVILAVERGQFTCFMGCAVQVRFDDGAAERWRAVGPSDHSTQSLFLRREAAFVKRLKGARVVRIEAEFFQEGRRVLEFPVARFDAAALR
ncbi:MAG: hypothetical protein R3A79_03590 [Nannocystaceae bacterium]